MHRSLSSSRLPLRQRLRRRSSVGNVSGDPRARSSWRVRPRARTPTGPGRGARCTRSRCRGRVRPPAASATRADPGLGRGCPARTCGATRSAARSPWATWTEDGYADLVVGSPGEAVGTSPRRRVGSPSSTAASTATAPAANKAFDAEHEGRPRHPRRRGTSSDRHVALLRHQRRRPPRPGRKGTPGENDGAGGITTLDGSGKSFTTKGSKTFGLGTLGYPTLDGAAFGAVLGR